MSCSGCRVLRKGCSDNCMLRQCLEWIHSPQAQAHATVFVAKFFGRAGLMSFISAVPEYQRPDLFRSLLYEAVGRTVNPVNGAVGLLWTGNWKICQSAVETVFRGGELGPLPEFMIGASAESENACSEYYQNDVGYVTVTRTKKKPLDEVEESQPPTDDDELDLCLMTTAKPREVTPSEESETTSLRSGSADSSVEGDRRKLLRLFI